MHFNVPLYFVSALIVIPLLWWANRKRKSLGHSQVSALDGINTVPWVGRAPAVCRAVFISLLILMLAQPQVLQKIAHMIIQTRAFLITVDISGSMSGALSDPDQQKFVSTQSSSSPGSTGTANPPFLLAPPPPPQTHPTHKPPTRAMAAREGVRQFLLHRQHDQVGLITFDDRCYYSEPIGNPKAVARKLDAILKSGSGTNFDGPSRSASEPGAIACSIQHFIDMHATKTRVFIMVTDGEDDIDPDRANVLAKAIHHEHIKMYVLGVGESWSHGDKPQLQQFVERPDVGGQVILVGDARQMREAFDKIDKLEKSNAEVQVMQHAQELYPYFAAAAFLVLLLWIRVSAYVRDQL